MRKNGSVAGDAASPDPPAIRGAAAAAAGIGSAAVVAAKQAPHAFLQAAPRKCVSKSRDGVPRHGAACARAACTRAAGSAASWLRAAAAASAAVAVAAKCLCKDDWVGQASQQDVPLTQELLAQHTCRDQGAHGAGCGALSQGGRLLKNERASSSPTTSRAGRRAGGRAGGRAGRQVGGQAGGRSGRQAGALRLCSPRSSASVWWLPTSSSGLPSGMLPSPKLQAPSTRQRGRERLAASRHFSRATKLPIASSGPVGERGGGQARAHLRLPSAAVLTKTGLARRRPKAVVRSAYLPGGQGQQRVGGAVGRQEAGERSRCRAEQATSLLQAQGGWSKGSQSTHRSSSLGVGSSMGTATPKPALGRLAMGADMRRTGT